MASGPDALSVHDDAGAVDVHHHFDPNQIVPNSLPGPFPMGAWSVARDVEDMERGGVATVMLSFFAPVAGVAEARVAVARAINEAGARLASDRPGQFALLANLPIPDIDASLAELAYGMDTLKAHGVCLVTNDGTRWLSDPHYEPLFAELNRRKAVVFVHPVSPDCCRNLVPGVPDTLIELGADTTRCIASLIFNGTTTRFPDVRFIFCHGGGATLSVIERFLGGTRGEIVEGIDTEGQSRFPMKQPAGGALTELRKMYFDTAQAANPLMLSAMKSFLPVSQILYGTDYPVLPPEITSRQLRSSGVLSATEIRAIECDNAHRLFPGLVP